MNAVRWHVWTWQRDRWISSQALYDRIEAEEIMNALLRMYAGHEVIMMPEGSKPVVSGSQARQE